MCLLLVGTDLSYVVDMDLGSESCSSPSNPPLERVDLLGGEVHTTC